MCPIYDFTVYLPVLAASVPESRRLAEAIAAAVRHGDANPVDESERSVEAEEEDERD